MAVLGYAIPEDFAELNTMKVLSAIGLFRGARKAGLLTKNTTIIEASSGNAAAAIVAIAPEAGIQNPVEIVIPPDPPEGKRAPLEVAGARLLYADRGLSTVETARARGGGGYQSNGTWVKGKNDYLTLDQYANPWNPWGYEEYAAPNILAQVPTFDAFVAPIGTGGTLIGFSNYFRKYLEKITMVGVHCAPGHEIPGVRDLNRMKDIRLPWEKALDFRIEVETRPSYLAALWFFRFMKLATGPSGGFTYMGALKFLSMMKDRGRLGEFRRVLVLFHDGNRPYWDRFKANLPLSEIRYQDVSTMPLPWEPI